MTDQGHDAGDRGLIGTPAIEDRSDPRTKGFAADLAPIALSCPAMDADIPFAKVASCRTGHIRAKCRLRIDDTPPSALSTEECHPIRFFFQVQPPNHRLAYTYHLQHCLNKVRFST